MCGRRFWVMLAAFLLPLQLWSQSYSVTEEQLTEIAQQTMVMSQSIEELNSQIAELNKQLTESQQSLKKSKKVNSILTTVLIGVAAGTVVVVTAD